MDTNQIKSYLHILAEQTEDANPKIKKKSILLFHELKQKHRKTAMNILNDLHTTDSKINKLSDKLMKMKNDDYVLKYQPNCFQRFIHKMQILFGKRISIDLILNHIKNNPLKNSSMIIETIEIPDFLIPTPIPLKKKKDQEPISPYQPKSNSTPIHQSPFLKYIPVDIPPYKSKEPIEDEVDPISPRKALIKDSSPSHPISEEDFVPKPTPKRKTKALSINSPFKVDLNNFSFTQSPLQDRTIKRRASLPNCLLEDLQKYVVPIDFNNFEVLSVPVAYERQSYNEAAN